MMLTKIIFIRVDVSESSWSGYISGGEEIRPLDTHTF